MCNGFDLEMSGSILSSHLLVFKFVQFESLFWEVLRDVVLNETRRK